MLVVISDLHFGDETATDNIPPNDFALLLDHVLDLAEHGGATKVTLLFLGDVFDLLRSEHWFHPAPKQPLDHPGPELEPFPLEHRPWGSARALDDPEALTPQCRERAREIADAIIRRCEGQLDILSGRSLTSVPDLGLRTRVAAKLQAAHARSAAARRPAFERLYLPGNHDRLARVLPDVRQAFLAALGATPAPEEAGLVHLQGANVVARHGHEYDAWNFEPVHLGARAPGEADFSRTPIGDPITTECLARLPYEVRWRLTKEKVDTAVVQQVYDHLRGIEDVRPLGAVLRWVTSEARGIGYRAADPRVLAAIDEIARSLVPRLLAMPYAKAWARRRLFGRGFGNALELLGLGVLSRLLPIRAFAALLGWRPVASWLSRRDDRLADDALAMLGAGGCYAVLGHTHDYRYVPLRAPAAGAQQVYFNSGTWRPRVYEVRKPPGFVRTTEMSYVVFHDAGANEPPGCVAWSGAALG